MNDLPPITTEAEYQAALDRLSASMNEGLAGDFQQFRQLLRRMSMKTSARNQFVGTVTAVLGDGVAQAPEAFADPARFTLLPASLASLTAEALGSALLDEVRAGRTRDVTTLEPEYLRPPDAALPQVR